VIWRHRDGAIPLDRPILLGVLNVTPDSFSDGGLFFSVDSAVQRARTMAAEGADLIDIGGESTRPQGAVPVSEEEECARVLPVIHAVRAALPATPLSVDTVKSRVAAAALEAGASAINDVSALRLDPRMGQVCAECGAGVILMHSRGGVADMATYAHASYGRDPTGEVAAELADRVRAARAAGIAADQIVLDPGIGFAKRSEQSLQILAELPRIAGLGFPILVGASRKRFIGEITQAPTPAERAEGSVGANVAALILGASFFRVHDVAANRHALDVAWQIARRIPGRPVS
jgi:dihydropteroate synthase